MTDPFVSDALSQGCPLDRHALRDRQHTVVLVIEGRRHRACRRCITALAAEAERVRHAVRAADHSSDPILATPLPAWPRQEQRQTADDRAAIARELWLEGKTTNAIARRIGVDPRSVRRYLETSRTE